MTLRKVKIEILAPSAFPKSLRSRLARAIREATKAIPNKVWIEIAQRRAHLEVSLALVSPKRMAVINQAFRQKDRATDVLSFPAPAVPGSNSAGEILICPAVAKKQLADFGTTYAQELERLAVHGVLHLFGYDHETSEADAKKMFTLQEKILRSLKD